jgi:prepilin-type N-terminal cleavage/methylation domain-containing protein
MRNPRPFPSCHGAFSLVELLVVVALVALLSTLLVLNSQGLLQARGVSGAAALLNDTLRLSSQSAVSGGRSTYLVIRTTGPDAWRRIGVFQQTPGSAEWEQIDRWRNLPPSAYVDPDYDPASEPWTRKPLSLSAAHSRVPPPATPILDSGTSLAHGSDYFALGFLAGGGIIADDNAALRIAAGRTLDGTVVIDGGESPSNWVKLIVEKISGQPKQILP